MGKSFFDGLIEVSYELDSYSISGYVTKPTASRASRSMQYFFINDRFIKNRIIGAAVDRAFSKMITSGKFAGGVIFLSMPAPLVDVNVHPNKTEVRFKDDRDIFDVVYRGVSNALLKNNQIPALKLERKETLPSEELSVAEQQTLFRNKKETEAAPVFTKNNKTEEEKKILFNQNNAMISFVEDVARTFDSKILVQDVDLHIEEIEEKRFSSKSFEKDSEQVFHSKVLQCAEPIEKECETGLDEAVIDKKRVESDISSNMLEYDILGEVFGGYVVVKFADEVLFVDKHAAHERYTYETIKENIGKIEMQTLLVPIAVNLNKNDYDAVINNIDILSDVGFMVEDFGMGSVVVREAPMVIKSSEIEDAILDMAKQLSLGSKRMHIEVIDEIIHSVSCRSSLMYGKESDELNLRAVVDFVLKYKEVRYCPHGRPVAYSMTKKQLDKQFMRI